MKRVFLAGVSALAVLAVAGAANAADLARRPMPTKAPEYMAPPVYNWTGFYVGINGGGAWGTSNWTNAGGSSSFNANGAMVGGTAGYNWQMGQAVFGLEGDVDWSGIKGSGPAIETKNNWLGTFRGRLGYAFDRVLPYVTGGLAVGDLKANTALGSASNTRTGWTAGAGVEAAISGPLTAKVEYLYVDLGKMNCGVDVCGVPTDVKYHANVVRAGLNYHF